MPPTTITPLNLNDTLPEWTNDFPTNTGSTLTQLSTESNGGGGGDGGAIVIMLRHTACPFCAEILNDLKNALPDLRANNVTPIIIHQATESDFVANMLDKAGHAETPRIADPERKLYDLFGVKNGNPWQLFGPQVIWGLVRILRKGLHPPRKKIGSLRRLNGSVFIHKNTLIARANYKSQSDRTDLNQLCTLPT